MRYIKKFNESNQYDIINKYFQEHLINLTDNKYSVNLYDLGNNTYRVYISIVNESDSTIPFYWKDIRLELFPFLEYLSNDYELMIIYDRLIEDAIITFEFMRPLHVIENKGFTLSDLDKFIPGKIFKIFFDIKKKG